MDPLIARTVEELPTRFNAATDLLAPNLVAGRGGKVAVIDHNGATTYAELALRVSCFVFSILWISQRCSLVRSRPVSYQFP
jgi:hypothetical protein